MGEIMGTRELTRRRFLVAAITFSGVATGATILRASNAWAQSGDGPDASMIRLARLMFPHDEVVDEVFAEILDDALGGTAADGSFEATLDVAADALPAGFIELDEAAQIEALTAVQDEAFFGSVFAAVRLRLYDHPACWRAIGYGGPSFADGGYLHRGAGEIDWLPEAD
jgi:hypothetical protein